MKLQATTSDGEHHIWAVTELVDDPTTSSEAFIIGTGNTRQTAIQAAIKTLLRNVEILEVSLA